MGPGSRFSSAAVCALMTVSGAGAALADAIDGSWCDRDGRRIEISGAAIVTPGGNRISGEYSRHAFSYIVPAGEEGAGSQVDMDLLGEYDMRLWPKGRTADPPTGGAQHWKRCAAPTS